MNHDLRGQFTPGLYIVANGRTQIFSQSVQIVSLEAVEAQEMSVGHEVERTAHVASVGLLRAESSHTHHQVTTAAHRHRNLPRYPAQLGQHRRINVRQGIRSEIGLTYRIRADKLRPNTEAQQQLLQLVILVYPLQFGIRSHTECKITELRIALPLQ